MGSIEVFRGKRGTATLADVWRIAPLRGSAATKVRAARLEDFAAIRALQRRAQPGLPTCTLRQFESQRGAFPDGQLVALCEGEIVGVASSLVVKWEGQADATWKDITGDGFFSTHAPEGGTLYAAQVCVEASRHGYGVGRALHQALRKLGRRRNLRRIVGAVRLAGYGALSETMTPERYARQVICGDIDDPMLRQPLAQGYQYCGILEGYMPEDAESRGHAALIVWLNPMYAPPGPPAFETERPRKCA